MSLQVNSYPIASYHQQAGGGGGSSTVTDFYPAYASHQLSAQHSAVSGTRYSPYTATDSRPLSSSSGEHLYPSPAASSTYFPGWSQQRAALWPSSDSYIFPASVMSPTLNGAASLAAAAAASVTGVTGDFGDMQHGASAVTGGFRMPKRRTTANKKERRRTLSINTAFASLRGCIPNVPSDTKLSKIKTLRLATSYIAYLMDVLSREDSSAKLTSFKADISRKTESKEEKKRREAEEMLRPTSSMVERKAKGRTGWPQHVWAAELGTGGTVAPPAASSSSSSVSVPPPHHDSHLLHQQPIL